MRKKLGDVRIDDEQAETYAFVSSVVDVVRGDWVRDTLDREAVRVLEKHLRAAEADSENSRAAQLLAAATRRLNRSS